MLNNLKIEHSPARGSSRNYGEMYQKRRGKSKRSPSIRKPLQKQKTIFEYQEEFDEKQGKDRSESFLEDIEASGKVFQLKQRLETKRMEVYELDMKLIEQQIHKNSGFELNVTLLPSFDI